MIRDCHVPGPCKGAFLVVTPLYGTSLPLRCSWPLPDAFLKGSKNLVLSVGLGPRNVDGVEQVVNLIVLLQAWELGWTFYGFMFMFML